MPRVVVKMQNASNALSVAGTVAKQSDPTNPLRQDVGVRMSRDKILRLDAGKYLYRFDVTTGSGRFDVLVEQGGLELARESGDTGVSDSNYVLRFTVKP